MKFNPKKPCKVIFTICMLLSIFLSPDFADLNARSGFTALADDTISITGKVLAPPVKPLLIGDAVCTDKKLSIKLDWPTDEGSDSFDIKRNGELLATNIINSNYEDNNVSTETSNTYQVIARGPMGPGSATSDEIKITTPAECIVAKPPFIQEIKTLDNEPVGDYGNRPQTEERRPSFSGSTNIPNAKIEIIVDGTPKIYQTIFANINGFWTWQSPEVLDYGVHTIFVTAIDPNNPSNTASDDFQFEISKNSSDNNGNSRHNSHKKKSGQQNNAAEIPSSYIPNEVDLLEKSAENAPFQISVVMENFNHRVFAGENLSLHIDFSKKTSLLENKDYQVFYEIINAKNEIIYVDSENINIFQTKSTDKKIPISAIAPLGDYRIRVKAYDGKILIAGENFFSIHELPLINIGFCQLSLTQLIRSMGWLIIGILLIFLLLLKRERRESEEGIYHMTESYLKKSNFFSKKNK